MSGTTFDSKSNRWFALSGGGLLLVLAVGLLLTASDARSVMQGYGGGFTCRVNAYNKSCDPKVDDVTTSPKVPRARKGFAVNFSTTSGGEYLITAQRKAAKKKIKLADGVTAKGTFSIKKLGKRLKAGTYTVTVTITVNTKSASDKRTVKIK